jgi:hypothetical protein
VEANAPMILELRETFNIKIVKIEKSKRKLYKKSHHLKIDHHIFTMATLSNAAPNAIALGAFDTSTELYCFEIARPRVGPNDVALDIRYCGMCHSDCHACNGDWGLDSWPIALDMRCFAVFFYKKWCDVVRAMIDGSIIHTFWTCISST